MVQDKLDNENNISGTDSKLKIIYLRLPIERSGLKTKNITVFEY